MTLLSEKFPAQTAALSELLLRIRAEYFADARSQAHGAAG